jgi:hypothetical protein
MNLNQLQYFKILAQEEAEAAVEEITEKEDKTVEEKNSEA